MSKTALLIGSTGLVGSHLLGELLGDEEFSLVITPVRKEIIKQHDKHMPVLFDFNTFSGKTEIPDFDVLFICIGTTIKKAGSQENFRKVDYDYSVKFIDFASEKNCSIVVLVSSVGADSESSIFYSKVKGELEEYLQAKSFKGIYILRPGFIIGERQESRPLEKLGGGLSVILDKILGSKLGAYRPTKAEDIAVAMLKLSISQKEELRILDSNKISEIAAL
jgi:uncharacterized protein YbjT (DUF2867 family)